MEVFYSQCFVVAFELHVVNEKDIIKVQNELNFQTPTHLFFCDRLIYRHLPSDRVELKQKTVHVVIRGFSIC